MVMTYICIYIHLRRRENGLLQSKAIDKLPSLGLPRGPIVAVLVRDPLLERVVGLGLNHEVPEGLEDGGDLCAGLPVLGLEDAEADVAEGVVCDVWVVEAGDELDDGGLEGVVCGQGEDDAEAAWVEGRRGGRGEDDVPCVEGGGGGQGDGEAFGGVLGDFGEFLGDAFGGHCGCFGLDAWVAKVLFV